MREIAKSAAALAGAPMDWDAALRRLDIQWCQGSISRTEYSEKRAFYDRLAKQSGSPGKS
jgi:hypothetical protein